MITQTLRNSELYAHCPYFLGKWYYKTRSLLLLYWLWSFTNKPQERIVRAVWKVGRKLWKRVCFESLMWDRCQTLMMVWRLKQEWLQYIILSLCKSQWRAVLVLLCVKASREKLCLCVCDLSSVSLCCRRPYYSFIRHLSLLNPLSPELNPICYLLALLEAHHFLHVSRIRVKLLTFRLLMSYIYIWSTHSWCF